MHFPIDAVGAFFFPRNRVRSPISINPQTGLA